MLTVIGMADRGMKYAIVKLDTLERRSLSRQTHPFYDIAAHGMANQENQVFETDHVGNLYLKELPENFALVSTGTFCGKPATAHIYLNTANMTKFLAA